MIWLAWRASVLSRRSRIAKVGISIVYVWVAPRHLMRWWRMRNEAISGSCGESWGESERWRAVGDSFGLSVLMMFDMAMGSLMWSLGDRLGAGLCWLAAAALLWAVVESVNLWGDRN